MAPHPAQAGAVSSEEVRNGRCRPFRSKAASNPAPFRYQARTAGIRQRRMAGPAPMWRRALPLDLVVVLADADDVGNVVFLFFLFSKKSVVLVVAEIDLDFVLDLGKLVAGSLGLLVSLFQRDDLRPFLFSVEFLALDFLFLLFDGRDRAGFEVGARIG